MECNQLALSGHAIEVQVLRYTPAGIPLLNFTIAHVSEQVEAGIKRRVECEVPAMALGEAAVKGARLRGGDAIRAEGFLARRSLNSRQLVLHVNSIETI